MYNETTAQKNVLIPLAVPFQKKENGEEYVSASQLDLTSIH